MRKVEIFIVHWHEKKKKTLRGSLKTSTLTFVFCAEDVYA
jgi:hypothetical protein